jgi:hypothetical protein
MSPYRKVQLYFECSEETTEFISEMCGDTNFMDAGITFTDEGANREVDIRFWLVGETSAIIMGVNAIPFGPPIGVVVFLTIREDVTFGNINNFTLDGPGFGINLGRPDDSAESWVFSIPSLRTRSYGMGNLFRIRWKDRSVMSVEYENSLPVSGVDAL